eukprot:263405_1
MTSISSQIFESFADWFLYDSTFVTLSMLILFTVLHTLWRQKQQLPMNSSRIKFNAAVWLSVGIALILFTFTQVNGSVPTSICCSVGFYVLRNIFWDSYYKYYQYPPYISLGIPFLGNAVLFYQDQEKFCGSVVCKDGTLPLTSVLLGYQTMIYVNDLKTAKQILKTEAIGSNRPRLTNEFQNPADFAFLNGKKWYKRRKFLIQNFGTITNSAFIHQVICRLFRTRLYDHFEQEIIPNRDGKWISSDCLSFIAMYTIMTLLFDTADETRCNLNGIDDMNGAFYQSFLASIEVFVPAAMNYISYSTLIDIKLPFIWKIFSAKRLWHKEVNILRQYLIKNKILYNAKQWNTAHPNKSIMVKQLIDSKEYSVDELVSDCHALLSAGMETTAKQIEFGLVCCCQYPSVQELVATELIAVARKHNEGTFHPKLLPKLHAFRAFVHEILRFGIVSPFGLPHCCLDKDVDVNGYTIYKGSSVMINHLAIHHQATNGNVFDINRWLDREGKFKKIKNFMVFGYASRDCIGQNIAMQEMYSVFALVLSRYVVYNKDVEGVCDIKRTWNIARDIQPAIPIFIKHRE